MTDFFKRYWNLLLWLGLFLSVAGLTAGAVSGNWTPLPGLLLVFGVVVLGIWLIYLGQFQRGFWTRRSTEAGTNALVSTLAVLAILGVVNLIAARASVRLDLTETQRFTLAPQTQALLQGLEEPAKVWLFSPQPNEANTTLLENYRRVAGGNFDYEYVDPQANPGLVQQFDVGQVGDVFLEVGEQRQYVQTVGVEPLTEAQLTRSLANVLGGDRLTVYFLQGHGEPTLLPGGEDSISKAVRALEEATAVAEPLNLIEAGRVPEDADVVVLVSPESQLFAPEIEALQAFLNEGGGVLALVDPNTDPGLSGFLDEWGIGLGDRVAIDPERWVQGYGPVAPLVIDYGDHPITEDFGQNYSLFPVVRPVEYATDADENAPDEGVTGDGVTDEGETGEGETDEAATAEGDTPDDTPENAPETSTDNPNGVQYSPLLFTSNASWAEANLDESPDWELNPEEDAPGPLVLAVAAEKPVDDAPPSGTTPTPRPTASPTPESGENVTDPQTEANAPAGASELPIEEAPENTSGNTPDESDTEPEAELDAEPEAEPEENARTARLTVVGDSDFMTDAFFDGQLNGDFFLNSVQWLAQQDTDTLSIRPREAVNRNLVMTPRIARLLSWTALATFPVIGFAASAILWWTRR